METTLQYDRSSPKFASTSNTSLVRPEPRRAYADDTPASSSRGERRGSASGQQHEMASRSDAEESAAAVAITAMAADEISANRLLLQQAANYASLATVTGPSEKAQRRRAKSSTSSPSNVDALAIEGPTFRVEGRGLDKAGYYRSSNATPSMYLSTAAPVSRRRLTRPFRNARPKDPLPPSSGLSVGGGEEIDDVEGYDAPRLSISSAESSGGSEVKTPESVDGPPSLLTGGGVGGDGSDELWQQQQDHHHHYQQTEKTRVSSFTGRDYRAHLIDLTRSPPETSMLDSPPLIDLIGGLGLAEGAGLATTGTMDSPHGTGQKRAPNEEALPTLQSSAAILINSENDLSHSSTGDNLAPSMQVRGSTIRSRRRPDTLMRLPSSRTDDTAHPLSPRSIPSVESSAAPTPLATADNGYGRARDPMDLAIVTSSGQGRLSLQRDSTNSAIVDEHEHEAARPMAALSSDEDVTGAPHKRSSGSGSGGCSYSGSTSGSGTFSHTGIASPDSWRSLLPEHDPFFISSEALSSASSSRSASGLEQHSLPTAILTPQRSMSMSQHTPDRKCEPVDVSALSPPPTLLPFLDSRPAPASTELNIETHAGHYALHTKLPGFHIDGISLTTSHNRQLIIRADKWDAENGGHFERRISFGEDANLSLTRAKFDGMLLQITVPKR